MSVSHKKQAAQSESSTHPFSNSKNLLVVIPDDKIDIEEESRLYDEFCRVSKYDFHHPSFVNEPSTYKDDENEHRTRPRDPRSSSPTAPPSVFSKDIWLGDNLGASLAFARDVKISGWTSVGDKLGGAYIGAYHAHSLFSTHS